MEEPAELAQVKVALDGGHLGEPGTPETLIDHLGRLKAADIIQAAAKLLHYLEAVGRSDYIAVQADLARELYPDAMRELVLARLTTTDPRTRVDAVVYPQQLRALVKLGMALGQPGPPTSFDERTLWSHFLFAAAQVTDVKEGVRTAQAIDWGGDLVASLHLFRQGASNSTASYEGLGGRAYRLWFDSRLPFPDSVETPEEFSERTIGVSLRAFVAIALAPAIARVSDDPQDPHFDAGSALFEPAEYFCQTRFDGETVTRILDLLTHAGLHREAVTDEATYWSFTDLATRPYVRAPNVLIAASTSLAYQRATTGVFWMLHSAHRGEVEPFTTHFGLMFEDYCLRLAEDVASETTTVTGEITYGPRNRRTKSSDIIISTLSSLGAMRIFVECRAIRPRESVAAHGDIDAWSEYCDELVAKLAQLDARIADHIADRFSIPGDLARRDDPYFPILVVDEPFQWTFAFRNVINGRCAALSLLRDHRVAQPIICDVGEFENLFAAVERGAHLGDLVRGYLLDDRRVSLEQYLANATADLLHLPELVGSGFRELSELAISELGFREQA